MNRAYYFLIVDGELNSNQKHRYNSHVKFSNARHREQKK